MKSSVLRRLAGIIVVAALALGLAGCSALKLGYGTLPELLYWWLDGYADFSEAQAPVVRGELRRLHDWQRRQQLPRVADLLGRLEGMASGEISPQQACAVVREVQDDLREVADAVSPAVGGVATGLSAKQRRHMQRKFQDHNERFREEWVDVPAAERQDKRLRQMLDRLETVYGRLDEPQRALLRQGIAASGYDPARILADRERRQQDLLQTLQQLSSANASPQEARDRLRAWVERAQHSPDPAYRAWQEGLVQEGCRVFSEVHRSTTAAQREHAVQRLRAYQRDLRELAADAR